MLVFEAILVAVLILTSILFYTTLQRPTTQVQPGGIDLGVVAGDTLIVMEASEFTDPLDSGRQMNHTEWLERLLQGEAAVVDLAGDFLDEVLPTGTQYQLRLHNGHAAYSFLPEEEKAPRNARAASRILVQDWDAFAGNAGTGYNPGDALDFSTWTTLRSPAGTDTAPSGGSWLTEWTAQVPGEDAVPDWALYGVWEYEAPGCIPCYIEVTDAGILADQPVYLMQLVVWFGV